MKLWTRLNDFVARAAVAAKREEGQTMVEYGLIIALIAIVVAVVLLTLGNTLSNTFTNIVSKL